MAAEKKKSASPSRTLFLAPFREIRARYRANRDETKAICAAVEALGPHLDISGMSRAALQKRIGKLHESSVCLVGGYALIPCFVRDNPSSKEWLAFKSYGDDDASIPTDAPYAADPSDPAGELVPERAISRIPDGAPLDAAGFLKTLRYQAQAMGLKTNAGSFEAASDDLARPAREISAVMRSIGGSNLLRFSPRDGDIDSRDLTSRISGRGRLHLLLHGNDRAPWWSTLYGRKAMSSSAKITVAKSSATKVGIQTNRPSVNATAEVRALSAPLFDLCDLRGAMVALTSCYGAMLDDGDGHSAGRSAADQIALACLGHGAKAVFGATRANWIELQQGLAFGPSLTAHLWTKLGAGLGAAEALRQAKGELYKEMANGARSDVAFAAKTLLQAHCFGHPLASL